MTRGTLAVGVALIAATLAAPATAGAATTLQYADACGENGEVVRVNGQEVASPLPKNAGFDVRSTTIDVTGDGLAARMEMCGAVPAPALPGANWSVNARTADGCFAHLTLVDSLQVVVVDPAPAAATFDRIGTFTVTCPGPGGVGVGSETEARLPASAVTVDGSTITLILARADLPAEALARVAPGTQWSDVATTTSDGVPLQGVVVVGSSFSASLRGAGNSDVSSSGAGLTFE